MGSPKREVVRVLDKGLFVIIKFMEILQILGVTGVGGILGGLVISLVDHFFIKSRELKAKQWEIKKNACLSALSIIDSFFSNIEWNKPNSSEKIEGIQKQNSPIRKAREAQNKLILTCKDTEIVNVFTEIIFSNENQKSKTELLDKFRELIRKELGFGGSLDLDKEKSWFAKIDGMTED